MIIRPLFDSTKNFQPLINLVKNRHSPTYHMITWSSASTSVNRAAAAAVPSDVSAPSAGMPESKGQSTTDPMPSSASTKALPLPRPITTVPSTTGSVSRSSPIMQSSKPSTICTASPALVPPSFPVRMSPRPKSSPQATPPTHCPFSTSALMSMLEAQLPKPNSSSEERNPDNSSDPSQSSTVPVRNKRSLILLVAVLLLLSAPELGWIWQSLKSLITDSTAT